MHRLVAQAFLDNPCNYGDVNHINCIKTDNRVENLEWCTRKHNIDHAVENKLHNFGEKHGEAILTEIQVKDIRFRYDKKLVSQRGLAKEYGVSRGCITGIINNKNWRHLL